MFRYEGSKQRPPSQQLSQPQPQPRQQPQQPERRADSMPALDEEVATNLRRVSLTEEEIQQLIDSFEDAKCCDDPEAPQSPPQKGASAAVGSPPESPPAGFALIIFLLLLFVFCICIYSFLCLFGLVGMFRVCTKLQTCLRNHSPQSLDRRRETQADD